MSNQTSQESAFSTIVQHTEIIVEQIGDLDEHAQNLEATCKEIEIPHKAREKGKCFKKDVLAYSQSLERFCIRMRGSLKSYKLCKQDNFIGWQRCVHQALSDLEGELDSMGEKTNAIISQCQELEKDITDIKRAAEHASFCCCILGSIGLGVAALGALALFATGVAMIPLTFAVVQQFTVVQVVAVATGTGVVSTAINGVALIHHQKSAAKAETAVEKLGVVRAGLATSVKEKFEGLRQDMDKVRELVEYGNTHGRINMNNENVYDGTIKTGINNCLDRICNELVGLTGRARSLMVVAETMVFEESACFIF